MDSELLAGLCVWFPLQEKQVWHGRREPSASLCIGLISCRACKDRKPTDTLPKIYTKPINRIIAPLHQSKTVWAWVLFSAGAGFVQIVFVYVRHLQEAKVLGTHANHQIPGSLSASSPLPSCLGLYCLESHEQRSLADYSPGGRKESDMTEATEHTLSMLLSIFSPEFEQTDHQLKIWGIFKTPFFCWNTISYKIAHRVPWTFHPASSYGDISYDGRKISKPGNWSLVPDCETDHRISDF